MEQNEHPEINTYTYGQLTFDTTIQCGKNRISNKWRWDDTHVQKQQSWTPKHAVHKN